MKKIIYSMLALALSVGIFTSCEDVPAPYENPNNSSSQDTTGTVTPTGDGTQANPYNVIAALDTIKALKADTDTIEMYVKGKIVSITEIDSTNYGNATYYISDDGTKTNQLYIYRSKDLGNKKFTSASIKVGDEVVVYGKFVNYKGNTPETAPNKSYLYSVNGNTSSGTPTTPADLAGTGTKADPYNVAAALKMITELGADVNSADSIYVKGKIVSISSIDSTTYGNATYYISDDGTTTNQLYIYRSKDLGNKKFTSASIKVGDDVVICGQWVNYKGNTPETVANKSFLYSLNGKTAPETTTPEEPSTPTTGVGTVSGNTVELAMVNAGLTDKAANPSLTLVDGTKLVFAANGGSTAVTYYATGNYEAIRMYAKNMLTVTAGKAVTKVEITTSAPYNGTKYNGNDLLHLNAGGTRIEPTRTGDTTVIFDGINASTFNIINDFTDVKGGVQLRIMKIVITYAQ